MKRLKIYLNSLLFLVTSIVITLLIAILVDKSSVKEYIDPINQLPILGPGIASFLLILFSRKGKISDLNFKKINKSVIYIIVVIILYNLIILFVQIGLKNIEYSPKIENYELFGKTLTFTPFVLFSSFLTILYAGFGEEIGWRGYMFNKLKHLSFIEMTFLLNIVWALWHLPMFVLGGMGHGDKLISFGLFTIMCVEYGILLNYIRIKTNSVFGAILLHPFANICGFIISGLFTIKNEFWAAHPNIIAILIFLPFSIYYYRKGKEIYENQ